NWLLWRRRITVLKLASTARSAVYSSPWHWQGRANSVSSAMTITPAVGRAAVPSPGSHPTPPSRVRARIALLAPSAPWAPCRRRPGSRSRTSSPAPLPTTARTTASTSATTRASCRRQSPATTASTPSKPRVCTTGASGASSSVVARRPTLRSGTTPPTTSRAAARSPTPRTNAEKTLGPRGADTGCGSVQALQPGLGERCNLVDDHAPTLYLGCCVLVPEPEDRIQRPGPTAGQEFRDAEDALPLPVLLGKVQLLVHHVEHGDGLQQR